MEMAIQSKALRKTSCMRSCKFDIILGDEFSGSRCDIHT